LSNDGRKDSKTLGLQLPKLPNFYKEKQKKRLITILEESTKPKNFILSQKLRDTLYKIITTVKVDPS
jgi:hypothetical protein